MGVAALGAEEGRLVEDLQGLAVALFETDRHQGLELGRRPCVPGEGEDQPAVRLDLAVDAAEPAVAVDDRDLPVTVSQVFLAPGIPVAMAAVASAGMTARVKPVLSGRQSTRGVVSDRFPSQNADEG